MSTQYLKENTLLINKNILIYNNENPNTELTYIIDHFCGKVINAITTKNIRYQNNIIIYVSGDINKLNEQFDFNKIRNQNQNTIINIIKQSSTNYDNINGTGIINIGEVPINIHNVGIYFRNFFDDQKDYFNLITNEHKFQSLTESNKKDWALRKGIYLSNVEELDDGLNFNLLRCSTNFEGPSDNFRDTDKQVIDKINNINEYYFETKTKLNHVLAQVYYNNTDTNDNGKITKERKAKISKHSDKTKDMLKTDIITFCSFYKDYYNGTFNDETLGSKQSKEDVYDFCYKETSILTKLRFVLKPQVTDTNLTKQFDVTLYPNSVFIIPLSTNRLYTHEIIPSILPINRMPTRMGYVIRCSNTIGVFKDGQTHIKKHGKYFKLEQPTEEDVKEIKSLYLKENSGTEMVIYDGFHFSLNNGDYMEPLL